MAVWTIRGGRNGEHEDTFLEKGVVSVGFGLRNSVVDFTDRDALRAHLGNRSSADQIWRLYNDIENGDMVVLPRKLTRQVAVGRISGAYSYQPELVGAGAPHVRPVEWRVTNIPRSHFDRDLLNSFGSLLTVSQPGAPNAEARIAGIANAFLGDDSIGEITATPAIGAESSGDDSRDTEFFEEVSEGQIISTAVFPLHFAIMAAPHVKFVGQNARHTHFFDICIAKSSVFRILK